MVTDFDRLALLLLAYLAGSIPTGVILGNLRGIDVRLVGSGNIGATNVTRALGSRYGAYTMVGDVLKGFLPVLLARWMAPGWTWISAIAFVAVLGHCFSIFLDFRGGKGVATSAGVFLAIAPGATLVAGAVWAATVALTRVSSYGAFVAVPVLLLLLALPEFSLLGAPVGGSHTYLPLALATGVLVLVRHKTNLRRILEGAENRFRKNAP